MTMSLGDVEYKEDGEGPGDDAIEIVFNMGTSFTWKSKMLRQTRYNLTLHVLNYLI